MPDIPLFAINPHLNLDALSRQFAADGRVQVRDVLTAPAADTVHDILARSTNWGLSYRAGETPVSLTSADLSGLPPDARRTLAKDILDHAGRGGYGFAFHHYAMVTGYLEKWRPGGPHDLLVEHINSPAFLDLARAITGHADLIKADAQATLYAPGQFLGVHDDSHRDLGWKIAYVLNFARDWRSDFGGMLLFHDADGDVTGGYQPRFNALNLFAVPTRHSVSFVPGFAPVGRYAITGWFRDR